MGMSLGQGRPDFRKSFSILVPEVCTVCGYSMKGLPEPRCPECGERVGEQEVVLVGRALTAGEIHQLTQTLPQQLVRISGLLLLVWLVFGCMVGFSEAMGTFFGVAWMLLFIGGILSWANTRCTIGRAPGILTLSPAGFRLGRWERKGRLTRWDRRYGYEVSRHGRHVRLVCGRRWGGFELWKLCDFFVPLNEEQEVALRQLLAEWNRRAE
jgi:hypothetical protein